MRFLAFASVSMEARVKIRSVSGLILTAALVTACSLQRASPTPTPAPTTAAPTELPTETLTPPAATVMTACVTTNSLRIRDRPSKDGTVVAGLNRGRCVTVHGTDLGRTWASISADELAGWVALQYLELSGNPDDLPVVDDVARSDEVAEVVTPLPGPTATLPLPTPVPSETSSPAPTLTSTSTPTATATSTHTATSTPVPTATRTPTSTPPPWTGLDCAQTSSHLGEFVSCRMQHAFCSYQPSLSGSPTICTDGPPRASKFTLRVLGSDWSDLDGKCIIVNGLIVRENSKPAIVAMRRSEVSTCP